MGRHDLLPVRNRRLDREDDYLYSSQADQELDDVRAIPQS